MGQARLPHVAAAPPSRGRRVSLMWHARLPHVACFPHVACAPPSCGMRVSLMWPLPRTVCVGPRWQAWQTDQFRRFQRRWSLFSASLCLGTCSTSLTLVRNNISRLGGG
eukprot:2339263-Prymnesium_polylepis.1